MFGDSSQVLFDVPAVGKRAKVDAAAGGACGSEQVLVSDGEIKGAVASHAKTGDGSMCPVGDGGIMGIDIRDQFFDHECFIANGGIDRAVEIPAVVASVGRDEDDTEVIGFFFQLWSGSGPLGIIAAMAVEEIDDGVMTGARRIRSGESGFGSAGLDDDTFDGFVHDRAMDDDGVDAGGESLDAYKEEGRKDIFHVEVFMINVR